MKHGRSDYDTIQTVRDVVRRLRDITSNAESLSDFVYKVGEFIDTYKDSKLIPEDEPVFLIRGNDPIGHFAVRHYAEILEDFGADKRLVDIVVFQSNAMRDWAERHKTKAVPDAPEAVLVESLRRSRG